MLNWPLVWPSLCSRRYDCDQRWWRVWTTGVQVRPSRLLLWLQGHGRWSQADRSHQLSREESEKETGLDLWTNNRGMSGHSSSLPSQMNFNMRVTWKGLLQILSYLDLLTCHWPLSSCFTFSFCRRQFRVCQLFFPLTSSPLSWRWELWHCRSLSSGKGEVAEDVSL